MKIKYFSKFTFIVTYFTGLLVPYLYFMLLRDIKFFFKKENIKNKIVVYLSIFLFLQLLSTLMSIFGNYNNNSTRYVAIYHNYFVFLFFIFGTFWLKFSSKNIEKEFMEAVVIMFYIIIIFSSLSFIYSLYTFSTVHYEGLLSIITGISNNYTQVNINSSGYLEDSIFPRTRLFATYSNTSAIVIYIVSICFLIENKKTNKHIFLLSLFSIFAAFSTGSRIVTVVLLLWLILYILDTRRKVMSLLMFFILTILFFHEEVFELLKYINDLRSDSSNTRLSLYITSIRIMLHENILFGIGLKPKVDIIKDLPIGSHSALIGYFVKNGILGGFFFLIGYLYVVYKFFFSLFLKRYKKKDYYVFSVFFLSIIYLFEDLDSYEFTAFLSGILIFYAFIKRGDNAK